MNKNKEEVDAINSRMREINKLLKNLTAYAITYLTGMLAKFKPEELVRHTEVKKFNAVDVKEVVKRDTPLRYDEKGYLGTSVSGGAEIVKVTPFDRIFFMRKSGIYTVCDVPDKLFVDTGMWYCNYAEKDIINNVLFTVIYRDPKTKFAYIKRCRIAAWIMNRDYFIAPDGMEVLYVDTREKFTFTLHYVKKPRIHTLEESFKAQDYEEKGLKANGVRLSPRETDTVEAEPADGQAKLF